LQCNIGKLRISGKIFPPLFSLFAPVQILWLRLAALRFLRLFAADEFSTRNISGRKRKKIPARDTPIAVTERLQMAFVILPVKREVVRVGEGEGERHRRLFHFRQQFQHPPTRSRGELDNFTTRAATARVSCRHIPTEAHLDQAGPTVTGHASLSLSRRNMRFRQAQRRRGAALGATPPPLAVASLPAVAFAKAGYHRVRPQNRRAVVLAVRFCSFYFAAVPL
jgi:hypothetical protein